MPHAFLIIAITSLLSLIGIYGYFVWMLQPAVPLRGP
jgi:nitrate reductase NapE component